MEDNNNQLFSIPFVVYESTTTKMERCIKRLIIALVISIVLMFASLSVVNPRLYEGVMAKL